MENERNDELKVNDRDESKVNDTNKLNVKDRYELIIKARNFHYENFNKWMTYFYVAIGALFIGYYTIVSSENPQQLEDLAIMLTVVGYIVSSFWYWSCKGYYYWNINFITLVNHYEEDLLHLSPEDRVYFVFANKKTQNNYFNPISGANISTSKVAILFAFVITNVWGILFFSQIDQYYDLCLFCNSFAFIGVLATVIVLTILGASIPRTFLKSKMDHFEDLKIDPLSKE